MQYFQNNLFTILWKKPLRTMQTWYLSCSYLLLFIYHALFFISLSISFWVIMNFLTLCLRLSKATCSECSYLNELLILLTLRYINNSYKINKNTGFFYTCTLYLNLNQKNSELLKETVRHILLKTRFEKKNSDCVR